MNRFIVLGRMCRDPELSYVGEAVALCKFSIAVNRAMKNKAGEKVADFFDCTCWKHTAENIKKYFQKGSLILIEGRIEIDKWESREGEKRSKAVVQVERFDFCESKAKDGSPAPADAKPEREPDPGEQYDGEGIPF